MYLADSLLGCLANVSLLACKLFTRIMISNAVKKSYLNRLMLQLGFKYRSIQLVLFGMLAILSGVI